MWKCWLKSATFRIRLNLRIKRLPVENVNWSKIIMKLETFSKVILSWRMRFNLNVWSTELVFKQNLRGKTALLVPKSSSLCTHILYLLPQPPHPPHPPSHYWKDWTEPRNFHLEDHWTPTMQNKVRHNPTCERLPMSRRGYNWQHQAVTDKRRELSNQTGGLGNSCENRQTRILAQRGVSAGWLHGRSQTWTSSQYFKQYTKKDCPVLKESQATWREVKKVHFKWLFQRQIALIWIISAL